MKTYQLGSRDRVLIAKKKKGVTIQQKDSNKCMEFSPKRSVGILSNRLRSLIAIMSKILMLGVSHRIFLK